MIAIRNMVNLCISIDQCILDGVQTGRFMSQVKIELKAIQLKQQIHLKFVILQPTYLNYML